MNSILLIGEDYIKNNSTIYSDVDPKIFRMAIFETQNIQFKYALPTELYDDIFEQFEAYKTYVDGGGTDPIEDKIDARILALVNEAKPMLLYYTLYNAGYSLYTRTTNKGINNETSDYSETIEITILDKMRKNWKQKAESYNQLLNEFMYDNNSTYPEYLGDDDDCSITDVFSNPLYLGDEI